jgi:hypothetical protein
LENGVQGCCNSFEILDSGLCQNDDHGTFSGFINFESGILDLQPETWNPALLLLAFCLFKPLIGDPSARGQQCPGTAVEEDVRAVK